jgi:dTDP-4-amino-4,6-dideoxygalactose transaminase
MPLYQQEVYRSGEAPCPSISSPIAERVSRIIINLPMFTDMGKAAVERVANVVLSVAER